MKMQTVFAGAACALLVGLAPLAHADSMSLNGFRNHALPVLVTVDSHGKVTAVSPAYPLRLPMQRLLRSTLRKMITGPAVVHGKATASQAVINLAVDAVPQQDGKYKVSFSYVDAMPVPYGTWYWNHIDGHRLALVNDDGMRWRPYHRFRPVPSPRRAYPRRMFRPPMPARAPQRHAPAPVHRSR